MTLLFALCLTLNLSAQISKGEIETFLNCHSPKDVQRVTVITFNGYRKNKFSRTGDLFEAKSTTLTALENSLQIKDGTGKEMYIPYLKIKSLSFQPETREKYSMIRIDI